VDRAVVSYEVNDRLLLSTNFVISSGSAVTFPTGRYAFLGSVVPIYSERNAERLPTYHRWDVSANYKAKKKLLLPMLKKHLFFLSFRR